MSVRAGLGFWLLTSAALIADEPPAAGPSPDADATRVVAPLELLRIDFTAAGAAEGTTVTPAADVSAAPNPNCTYVRVGAEGFARLPLTDRNLPFAELELPVIEAMIAAHLSLHGRPTSRVSVTRQRQARGLVTVFGLVNRPGVYELSADATLADAIEAAGGIKEVPEPTPVNPEPALSPYYSTTPTPLASIPGNPGSRASIRSPAVAGRSLQVRLQHPDFDLQALAADNSAAAIPLSKSATTRLCVDGIILYVEKTPAAPLRQPETDDLFKPL